MNKEKIIIEPSPKKDAKGNVRMKIHLESEGEGTHYNLIDIPDGKGGTQEVYYSDKLVEQMLKAKVIKDNLK